MNEKQKARLQVTLIYLVVGLVGWVTFEYFDFCFFDGYISLIVQVFLPVFLGFYEPDRTKIRRHLGRGSRAHS